MATVYKDENGQLILDDPAAVGMMLAVARHNCRRTAELQQDRIRHFSQRITELGHSPEFAVITLINVDDPNGQPIAEMLMPGNNWQALRDRGEVPFARGLARRDGIQDILGIFDVDAQNKLASIQGVAVVVVDHNVADVYPVEEFL
jgi:hypothetical protein